MSKKKYLIDKKVILDCEKMTLSCEHESLRILNPNAICLLLSMKGYLRRMT